VVGEERRRVGAFGPPSGIGVMMAGPTIVAHATDEQKKRFLPDMVSGKEIWCQLFSEPGSGSDLASLQTKAVRDGDEWIVNGQKVWTSGAQFSRWGILIARTDPDAPKHKGITYFVIDMHQPGIEVRPLKEMTGGATFNEVFFNDARVPHENVIGEVNAGWGVAVTTLAHERNSLGASGMGGFGGGGGGEMIGVTDLDRKVGDVAKGGGGGEMAGMAAAFGGGGAQLIKMLPQLFGKSGDAIVRQELMKVYSLMEISRFTGLRAQAAAAAGRTPGPEVSTGKLMASNIVRLLRDTGLAIEGPAGMLMGSDAPLGGMLQFLALFSPAIAIAGGTDQVQRNIIGERVLGLPAEPRTDKEVPFRELKVGTQRVEA
jgi:alkylation response protein AidB-like acyl-CoA dehydrogenase